MVPTVTRSPRMQGLPPMTFGSKVILSAHGTVRFLQQWLIPQITPVALREALGLSQVFFFLFIVFPLF